MRLLLRILLPLLAWLASFSLIYGLHGLGCALGWAEVAWPIMSLFRWALLAAWVAAILLQLRFLLGFWRTRAPSSFIQMVGLTSSWVALGATLWTLFPIAVSSTCG